MEGEGEEDRHGQDGTFPEPAPSRDEDEGNDEPEVSSLVSPEHLPRDLRPEEGDHGAEARDQSGNGRQGCVPLVPPVFDRRLPRDENGGRGGSRRYRSSSRLAPNRTVASLCP